MNSPHQTSVRDQLCALLRDRPIEMTAREIARLLPPQPVVATAAALHSAKLAPPVVYAYLAELQRAGYVSKSPAPSLHELDHRWAWIPPEQAGGHRSVETWEREQFAALVAPAGKGSGR